MYWPSTPEDGEFVFRYADQPFLDPDEVLATYADWQDAPLADHSAGGGEDAPHGFQAGRPADQARHHRGVLPGTQHYGHSRKRLVRQIHPTAQDDRYTFVGGSTTGGWSCTTTSTPFPITRLIRQAANCATPSIWCAGICLRRAARPRTVPAWETTHRPSSGCRNTHRGMRPPARTLAEERQVQAVQEFGDLTRWRHSLPKHRARNGRSSWSWTSRDGSRTH